jgi:acyl-[acyl-carrier-protein]-phospholipid O-acyltransferase/long-chain-fatty-acid--[acyl-carrier-protein] ligase
LLTHTLYRVRVLGRENLPERGPGLLICNHISYADGFFLVASTHRLIRFVIWGGIANSPYLSWLARIMGVIPIRSTDGPKALAQSLRAARDALRNGELVCVFAEGQISRIGTMLKFKRGFEKVVQGVDAPIIPTFLDCVWGSIFSFQGGRFFWKWPKHYPYPVTVSFGKPLPPTVAAFELRQAVQELGADSVRARKAVQKPLHSMFIREAVRRRFRLCIADSRGTELTFGKSVAGIIALSRVFRRRFGPGEKMVGVLLPPSVGGTLVNLGLLTAGKIPINLNYTASSETIASCVEQCGIKTIISSPEVLKRIKLTLPIEPTAIESLKQEVTRLDKFVAMLGGFVLPGWITEHWLLGLGGANMDDLATVIFSSGSTGEPKGVMLSHHNVISNCEAVVQVIDPTPKDVVVGLLPLFHSFGFLVNLAVPFMVGARAVYHNNPLDSKEVGDLTEKYRGTILLATPTFLRAYTRKIPPEQLKTLRFILTGAEKLPREVAETFREKFGVMPLEGYGCTELSPVAAVNVPDFVAADGRQIGNKPGTVGHPIPGVAAKIVDPDTFKPLTAGENGLLLIKGPNVMQGYLHKPDMTAQSIRDGWYVTGDIANLDEDGFITITDRLSRFSKIAGEMVPHIRVEEAIRQVLGTDDQGGVVASVPDPTRGERLVVIHPPLPIPAEELWQKLNASGLPKLWVPGRDAFFEVPELPYLGSGKLDLKRIKELAREFAK